MSFYQSSGDPIDLDVGLRNIGPRAGADDVRLSRNANARHLLRQRSVDVEPVIDELLMR